MTAPAVASAGAVDRGLALAWFRFRAPDTEADYQQWRHDAVIPHLRLGFLGSFIAWTLGLAQLQVYLPEFVAQHPWAFGFDWWFMVPVIAIGMALTFVPPARRWCTLFAVFVNISAGIVIVWQAHRYLEAPGVAAGLGVTVAYFATAIFRLPPRLAVATISSYLLLCAALNWPLYDSGAMNPKEFFGYEVLLIQTIVLALLVNFVIERTMRGRFKSERIIERQTRALEEERASLSRFLSPEVTRLVSEQGIDETLKQQELDLTAVCCDLRGFTRFTESHGAERMGAVLRDYYEAIVDCAKRHGGTVKDFAGDGALILVGAPVPRDDHATVGAELARDLVRSVGPLLRPFATAETPLGIGAGVASGTCAVGAIGSQDRLEYTAVGSPVNLAARLCAAANDGEVLYAPDTVAAIGNVTAAAKPITVKGFDEALDVRVEVVSA